MAAPVLDFGRLDSLVQRADFRSRELLFNYKQTVLNAVREVDTAVDAYAAQQARLRHLADALAAARQAVTLATERFDRGLTDSLNVIDAQRQEFEIEQQYVSAQQSAAEELVRFTSRWAAAGRIIRLSAGPAAHAGDRCGLQKSVRSRRAVGVNFPNVFVCERFMTSSMAATA